MINRLILEYLAKRSGKIEVDGYVIALFTENEHESLMGIEEKAFLEGFREGFTECKRELLEKIGGMKCN